MLLIPAPVKSDGRLPTIKFGGTGAPLTLAVNCVIRSRTRFAVTVIGGPAFAGAVSRISTAWPGSNCDVSVAPWKALTNPLGAFNSSIRTWKVGLLRVTMTGLPTLTLFSERSSSSTTISKCMASSILNTTPSSSSSSASSSNPISFARKIPPGIIITSTRTTILFCKHEKLLAVQFSNSN